MPELINNFTGGKMNKDLDERLVPTGQYRDAWNVQVSTSDDSDIGSLQNLLGNTKIDNNIIPGDAVCVGSVADDKNNTLYLLLASNTKDIIVSWNSVSEQLTAVFIDINLGVLQYNKTRLITGINIVDDMLFWTDNFTEPKRINIPRSIEGTDQGGVTNTRLIVPERSINYASGINIAEENITVIKKGPKIPPVLRLEGSGSTSIKLYCGQPTNTPNGLLSFFQQEVGDENINIQVHDLIPGFYGNVIQQNYSIGDIIYLKATDVQPNGNDADLEEKWSTGSSGTYDIKLEITNMSQNTMSSGRVTFVTKLLEKTGDLGKDVYTVTNLKEPELIFEKKFPRFATRWKYSDGEYSPFSPFSEIAFVPGAFSYHPTKGYNLGMVNTLYAAHVEQFVPINIPDDVISIDILYRESNSPVIYVVDTISKNDPFIPGQAYNYWNSVYTYNSFTTTSSSDEDSGFKGTYKISSDTVSKAIPENQTIRHWDNVPRAALAQEIIGNRLVYGNYLQNYNLYSGSDNSTPYKANFEINIEDYNKDDFQLPLGNYYNSLPSIKSLRTYQVGIVYEDDYGRQTPVLTSESGVIKTKKNIARKQHRLTVRPLNDAPDWATSFKYFIKETSSEYYNLAMDRVFDAEDGNVWLSFPSSDRAKVDEETYLILKKDNNGAFVSNKARYKILSVKNEAPDFIKKQQELVDEINYDQIHTTIGGVPKSFGDPDTLFSGPSSVPQQDSLIFSIDGDRKDELTELTEIFNNIKAKNGLLTGDDFTLTQEDETFSIRFLNETSAIFTGRSQWYTVKKIFQGGAGNPFDFTMEKPFEDDIRFSYILTNQSPSTPLGNNSPGNQPVEALLSTTKFQIRKEIKKERSWFDGRFFVKIERDQTIDTKVISTPESNWVKVAQNRLWYLHSGEGRQSTSINASDNTTNYYAGGSITGDYTHNNGGYDLYGNTSAVSGSRIRTSSGSNYEGYHLHSGGSAHNANIGLSVGIEAHIPQVGEKQDSSNNYAFPTPVDNENRVMGIMQHYLGNTDINPGVSLNNPYVQESFWYIDRTYYHRDNTNNQTVTGASVDSFFEDNSHVDGEGFSKPGNSWLHDRMPGMRLDDDESPRTITISFTEVRDYNVSGNTVNSQEVFDYSDHSDQINFISKLKRGTLVKFSDDQTGDNGTPVVRKIVDIEGPLSVYNFEKVSNAIPNESYAIRLTWHITFDKPFGNPVYNTRGYNPLYTLKDAYIERDDGTVEVCPRQECTGGATYPWAELSDIATAHSTDKDHIGGVDNPTVMELYEDYYAIGDTQKEIAESPVIWETEPKQDVDIDIYYEASGSYPINVAQSKESPLRVGAEVRISKSNPDYYSTVTDASGETWSMRNNLDVGSQGYPLLQTPGKAIISANPHNLEIDLGSSANVLGNIRIEQGTILDIIFKGTRLEVEVVEDVNDATYTAGTPIRINGSIHSNLISLNWFNCYIFDEDLGVESDRIRDDFNAPSIDNGPKVSTTVVEGRYKEERRKSGMIYSGIYNSMSGVNNLNQFIVGEKITKDLNPVYGSIQKLHTRDTDLVTLCENKVLKVLANKDALFNADGNLALTSTTNVLGQAVPFMGEYGISENPESFASESYRAYFTDAKRGAVLRLSKDGLSPIHEFGMRNWFADYFIQDQKTMINAGVDRGYVFGSYDAKKNHYNVTFSDLTLSFSEDAKGWVSFKSAAPRIKEYNDTILHTSSNYPIDFAGISLNNRYYTFREGKLWLHHSNQVYNNFYDYQFSSSVSVVLNESPQIVKSFNTLNYEGSDSRIEELTTATINGTTYNDNEYYNLVARDGWYVNSIVTDRGKSTEQHGMVNEFIEKEGKWFNYIKGDTTNINNIDPSETSLQGIGLPNAISIPTTVYGCTDPNAINYNQNATVDDGSCVTCVYGCTDPSSNTYSSSATCDDGSCEFHGCTNAGAFNYNPSATHDPNNACLPYVYGCQDPLATNHNNNANAWCNSNPNQFNASNNWTVEAFDGGTLAGNSQFNCCQYPLPGCVDEAAGNYDPNADTDDGSCDYSMVGCSDPGANNYSNAFTGCDVNGVYTAGDTSCCTYTVIYGCTDSSAINNTYNPNATTPCGSSSDPSGQSNCINGQTGDNCCCDYAQQPVLGCTDSTAANYDSSADTDDGSCCYGGCSQGDNYLGTQPDIYGFCNNSACTGPPNYTGCTNPGVCDPSNGIYTGCDKCTGQVYCGSGSSGDCGYLHINYDPELCYDCAQANPGVTPSPCYDSLNVLGGNDVSTCIETVFGCMDIDADNYDPNATADDDNCQYTSYCCTDTSPGYCNYGAPGAVTPGNPSGSTSNCQNGLPSMCENTSCIGCIDPALGFHAGEMEDPNNLGTMIKVCRGTTYSNGPQTANLWQYTDPGTLITYDVCSKDGSTLDPLDANGNDNRDGWNATNYDPTANLIEYWGMSSHNTNNLPTTGPYPNCNYLGGGCTDNGNMPNTYVASQDAVNSGYGGGGSGYVSGSLTPGQPAFNYNPLASSDDGSCYPVIFGCQDPSAANTDAACTSGNFGWGIPGVVGDGDPWTDVNTNSQGCCVNTISGCTDNIAHRFIHTTVSLTTNEVSNTSDGFGYELDYHKGTHKAYIVDASNKQVNAGAFNYDPNANTLQTGVWRADVPVIGYDPNNIVNSVGVYSQLDATCAGDPTACAGSGNETACCYQAGCLDPNAFNFEYNGFGLDDTPNWYSSTQKEGRARWKSGVQKNRINYFVEGELSPDTCIDCSNDYPLFGNKTGDNVFHRTCADCAGNKAELFFVDPNTGASTAGTPTPGAYLSVNQVLLNADLSCCCYEAGCTDPTACNYYGDIDGVNSDGSSSYNPRVCQDDSSGIFNPLNQCYYSTAPFYYADNNCNEGSGCGTPVAGSIYVDQNQCCLEHPTACS